MSEWLDVLLEEITRQKEEEKAAREEADRRSEKTAANLTIPSSENI